MSNSRSKKNTIGDSTPKLGATVQRLRKAYNMSLGDLSEQSGVAKSIISQIEKNENNPTLNTVWKIANALDTSLEDVLRDDDGESAVFLEHQRVSAVPVLHSEDGLCSMRIHGWLKSVEWCQWYDFIAEPGGVLVSSPHPIGTVEHLSVLRGHLRVEVDGQLHEITEGECLRYKADRPHRIENIGDDLAHATMVNLVIPLR